MMNVIRIVVERLSRGKVLKRHIVVNGIKTPILVTPDAQLKYLKIGLNAFDRDLITIAEQFLEPGSNVWDIGANVGVFTFAAATVAYNGSILSVEADIWLARLIQRSARLKGNKDKVISVLPAAISEFNSVESFLIAKRGRARNALEIASGGLPMGGIREKQFVPALTLDTLSKAFPEPDFIKMDVEGAELLALKGGSFVISRIRPVFYIEVGQQFSKEIQRIFEKEGYRLFDGKSRSPIDCCVFNTFFAPEEKCAGPFSFNI